MVCLRLLLVAVALGSLQGCTLLLWEDHEWTRWSTTEHVATCTALRVALSESAPVDRLVVELEVRDGDRGHANALGGRRAVIEVTPGPDAGVDLGELVRSGGLVGWNLALDLETRVVELGERAITMEGIAATLDLVDVRSGARSCRCIVTVRSEFPESCAPFDVPLRSRRIRFTSAARERSVNFWESFAKVVVTPVTLAADVVGLGILLWLAWDDDC